MSINGVRYPCYQIIRTSRLNVIASHSDRVDISRYTSGTIDSNNAPGSRLPHLRLRFFIGHAVYGRERGSES